MLPRSFVAVEYVLIFWNIGGANILGWKVDVFQTQRTFVAFQLTDATGAENVVQHGRDAKAAPGAKISAWNLRKGWRTGNY